MENTELLLDCGECKDGGDLSINEDGEFVCNNCGLVDQVKEKPADELDILIDNLTSQLANLKQDEYTDEQRALIEEANRLILSRKQEQTIEDLLQGLTMTTKKQKRPRLRN